TNAVTGIATAYMDSIPSVILPGQVPTHAIGEDPLQECDTVRLPRPCVADNVRRHDAAELAPTNRKALQLAASRRPGPVPVGHPKDVTRNKCRFEYPKSVAMRSYNPVTRGHQGQLRKALNLLLNAERPLVYTGGGVILANAAPEL